MFSGLILAIGIIHLMVFQTVTDALIIPMMIIGGSGTIILSVIRTYRELK